MSNNLLVLSNLLICCFSGLLLRLSLTFTNQKWAGTFQHTLMYMLLPITTFVITKVISNNIALSLGMIGALSIVRFRNPVKNPLELVIYFVLITMGIAYSVNAKYGFLISGFSIFLVFFVYFISKLNFLNKYNFISLSFEEGSKNYIIEIISSKQLSELILNQYLIQSINNEIDNNYIYKLASQNKEAILKLHAQYKDNKDIQNIELNL